MAGGRASGELLRLWHRTPPFRWLLVDEDEDEDSPSKAIAACVDIEGLFDESQSPSLAVARPAVLLGCQPMPPMGRALDALALDVGNPGGAAWRRRIRASIASLADDGSATKVVGVHLQGAVTAVRPSALGGGLVDVTLDTPIANPMPYGARSIWELWRSGRPAKPGRWAGYDRDLRHQWTMTALAYHRHDAPDKPAGSIYEVDGRNVTDVGGFYCAIGEAVNGPGGYFGSNPDALHDCARGGWGAASPFRLVWRHSTVAREHLDRPDRATDPTFGQLLGWLTEDSIDVRTD
ncbi:barstar family protein [Solwaraspora sp. WMMD406]|uniref:barstar family protein n=1 Tax=Solwaraspora sp. WMMD406 TaxID=3016095 RepID=UPI002415AE11|nr:barstar family protein [Solwaraspora sp. WMMD406]MDG4768366.1 barstar family protein [Solwaraspora sp. WMMD406]